MLVLNVAHERSVPFLEGLRVPVARGKDAHSSLTFLFNIWPIAASVPPEAQRPAWPAAFQRIRAFRYPSCITSNKSNPIERLMLPTRSPRPFVPARGSAARFPVPWLHHSTTDTPAELRVTRYDPTYIPAAPLLSEQLGGNVAVEVVCRGQPGREMEVSSRNFVFARELLDLGCYGLVRGGISCGRC